MLKTGSRVRFLRQVNPGSLVEFPLFDIVDKGSEGEVLESDSTGVLIVLDDQWVKDRGSSCVLLLRSDYSDPEGTELEVISSDSSESAL